jgi:Cft2 family RNA processing exonuclease
MSSRVLVRSLSLSLSLSLSRALTFMCNSVVLASAESLSCGPAKQLFLDWAADPRNLVLFTQSPRIGTLAHDVLHSDVPAVLEIEVSRRVVVRLLLARCR